jgi:GxxExxY protein
LSRARVAGSWSFNRPSGCTTPCHQGTKLEAGYRLDLVVENAVIVEVKAVEALNPFHPAQLLTYMKLSGCRIGFLMNVHVALFKQGLKRLVL